MNTLIVSRAASLCVEFEWNWHAKRIYIADSDIVSGESGGLVWVLAAMSDELKVGDEVCDALSPPV